MTKFYLLLFSVVGWATVYSQNFEWLNNIPDQVGGRAMDLDTDGNLVIAGRFAGSGPVDFDAGPGVAQLTPASSQYSDLFLMKVDPNGNFMWANRFGGVYGEFYEDVKVDDQNFIYTTGVFKESVDFLPSAPPAFTHNVFVQKLDSVGNQIWARHFAGASVSYAENVDVDSQGNVYVSGVFRGSVDFDPGVNEYFLHANAASSGRSFVVKLDSSGVFQWAQSFGSNTIIYLGSGGMQIDSNDDVVLAGFTHTVHDFDPGPDTLLLGEYSKDCGYVIKLDGAGNLIWGKDLCSYNSDGRIDFLDITIDPSNNIALMGDFEDSVDFDPGSGQNMLFGTSIEDLFVVSITSSGDFNWARRVGAPTPPNPNNIFSVPARGNGVTSDAMGGIFVTGWISGSANFDEGITNFTLDPGFGGDMFIMKYDDSGEFKWALKTEGDEQVNIASGASGLDIQIGQNEEIYTTGHFAHVVDFDPGGGQYTVGQQGQGQFFILSLNQFELGIHDAEIVENFVYPNPTSGYIYLDEVAESILVLNASGQIVSTLSNDQYVDLSDQPSGMYTLLLDGKPYRVIRR